MSVREIVAVVTLLAMTAFGLFALAELLTFAPPRLG